MKYTRPFDIQTGAESTTQEWLDANLTVGFEGSIPPGAFYDRVNTEITTAIDDSGQTQSNADLGQLSKAIVLAHRLVENRTIYVPGDFDTLFKALSYLSGRIIPDDVFVTILCGAGDIEVDSSTGPILLDQPYGSRIRIQGQPLQGTGFPAPNVVDLLGKPAVEAELRARFPTRIVISGAVKGIFMKSGSFSRLSRLCIIGDGSAGQDGLCVGEWLGDIGTGNLRIEDFYAFNCGEIGIRANYAAAIQGRNVGGTHCVRSGLLAANSSSIQVTGSVIACRNADAGLIVRDQAFTELNNGAVGYFQHNLRGISAEDNGEFMHSATAQIDIRNNSGPGALASGQSLVVLPATTTGGGNVTADLVAQGGSFARVPAAAGLTVSPAANTIGNQNSYIQVT